jgi:hypothetical protein
MSPVGAPFAVSIVIEWENVGRIGDERACMMLRALHRQIEDANPAHIASVELILVFAEGTDAAPIRLAISDAGGGVPWRANIRDAPTPSGRYYELKNHGVEVARGDILIHLDSDVVPQPGWLDRLVATFRDPNAMVVSGATWTDYGGLYSAAMALGWTFPLPPKDDAVVPVSGFQANNFAFRAELRSTMSFPKTSQYRGQSIPVFERLRAEGRTILINRGAQVTHPPPAGLKAFTARALWSGHDLSVRQRRGGRIAFWQGMGDVARVGAVAFHCVATRFRAVNLGPLGALAAAAIVGAYHGLRALGFVAASIAPGLLHKGLTRLAP